MRFGKRVSTGSAHVVHRDAKSPRSLPTAAYSSSSRYRCSAIKMARRASCGRASNGRSGGRGGANGGGRYGLEPGRTVHSTLITRSSPASRNSATADAASSQVTTSPAVRSRLPQTQGSVRAVVARPSSVLDPGSSATPLHSVFVNAIHRTSSIVTFTRGTASNCSRRIHGSSRDQVAPKVRYASDGAAPPSRSTQPSPTSSTPMRQHRVRAPRREVLLQCRFP